MPRQRLLTVTIGPHVVTTAASEKAPAAFQQALFEVATFHCCNKCTPIGVRIYSYSVAWAECVAAGFFVT